MGGGLQTCFPLGADSIATERTDKAGPKARLTVTDY